MTIGCAISLLLFVSCGRHSAPPDPNTLTYNEPNGIASLDPAVASYRAATWAGSQIFNGLVELDSTLTPVPCLARTWTVDPAGLIWTFTLRSDVWFHNDPCFGPNGTRRVTAADVQYSIERICDARTKSTGLWAFRTRIVGADDFHRATRQGKSGHIAGISLMGDSVITIRLTKPFAPFLAILTMPYAWIVPREAVLTYGDDFGRHPVGTGPFEFTAWNQDIDLTLQRNTRYFKFDDRGRRLPYLDTVRVTFLRDTRNEFLEFTKGRYDLLGSVDPAFAATIFTDKGTLVPPYDRYRLYRVPSHSVEYYGMLQDTTLDAARRTPLATSRRLRQALNYAIDRHRIVTYLLRGSALPATHGVLPPSMPGFSDTVHGYTYDPERARQLLAEAGYPNGKGLPTLTLQLGNSERTTSVAEAVQDMWKEIGVNVEIRTVDFPQHLSMVRAGQLALWRTSWIGDYPDPENFLALFVEDNIAPNGPNTTRVHRRDLDSLYTLALKPTYSLTERSALYNRMERIILDESPWIFLYYDVTVRLAQPSVHGLTVDGTGRLVLENVFKTASR